jgi:hypothetical protein
MDLTPEQLKRAIKYRAYKCNHCSRIYRSGREAMACCCEIEETEAWVSDTDSTLLAFLSLEEAVSWFKQSLERETAYQCKKCKRVHVYDEDAKRCCCRPTEVWVDEKPN